MDKRYVRLALCALLVILGAAVVVGWLFHIEALKSVIPGYSTMKFNTALCFALVGIGLAATDVRNKLAVRTTTACGAVVAMIGALTLAEYIGGISIGLDELVVSDDGTLTGSGFPGRMSPLTAAAYVALGPAIILLTAGHAQRTIAAAHALVAFAGFIAFLAAAGYAFGAEAFWGIGFYTFMAIHSAVGLMTAATAGLMTRADEGWMGGFGDAPRARALVVQLLPISVVLPLFIGFLLLFGAGLGAYNAAFGFALFVPTMALALIRVTFKVAARARADELALDASEGRLRQAFAELRALNESLEQQVEDRTREREAAVAQLHEMQKLETLGQLTGGVAHDFNNLLTPIVGSLDLLRHRHETDNRSSRLIDSALQAAERARLLIARLLAFARRQTLEPRVVDICALVDGMLDLMRRSLGPSINIATDAVGRGCFARVDPNQLELALLNLAVNARDAMPNGGTLTIAIDPNADRAGAPVRLAPGDYVRIAVSDTGSGMDEATLARAVEPFFSTKGVGKGTGLGLSMVHGLCAQLGGAMTIASAVGIGTRVELWLPAVDAAAGGHAQATEHGAVRATGGTVTLLLVDDEELVRAGMAAMLTDLGYVVVEAASASDALQILREGIHVRGVVTDYLMPGVTGAEFIAELARSYPALPVLLVTGYANAAEDVPGDVPRLAKPFRQAELAQAVHRLVNRGRQPIGVATAARSS